MEHAARYHVRTHLDEDPVYYAKLSERIDEILDRLEERWDQIAFELGELIDEINAGRTDEEDTGLDPGDRTARSTTKWPRSSRHPSLMPARGLIDLTRHLVARIRRIIGVVGFWDNAQQAGRTQKSHQANTR